jgi:choline dehydrogenase-like flavoprotein
MALMSDHCDLAVIGSGLGGTTLAHRLASTGNALRVADHIAERLRA